ncbi:MAG: type II toxin-antitoxin system MqsR family toxin [Legionellales bacterium]|nr:type II toxin-antitoxin system MqsR family toxin [Legionellales bacterium]
MDEIKTIFSKVTALRITASGLKGARAMGFGRQEIIDTIAQLDRKNFVKSMTTYNDHRVWQDVYRTHYLGYDIYIKFQVDELGHFVISFKEK